MAYDFNSIRNPVIKRLFQSIFSLTAGHDHDGVNSKEVTVGTVADGAIATAKIADGALTADVAGRAKMADGFINVAKVANDAIETAKIKNANVTLAKVATTAKTHIFTYQIEDLGAGVDISDRVIFFAPAGIDVTLVSASIIPLGTSAGIDDSNNCLVGLTDGTNSIVATAWDSSPAFPSVGTVNSLGTVDATYKVLSAGEKLVLNVTNGATANPPAMMLQVVYTVADAV